MVTTKNETENLILSITRNCERLIEQSHTNLQETLEFKFTQPMETVSFRPSVTLGLDCNRMIGITSLKVYIFLFIIIQENIKL